MVSNLVLLVDDCVVNSTNIEGSNKPADFGVDLSVVTSSQVTSSTVDISQEHITNGVAHLSLDPSPASSVVDDSVKRVGKSVNVTVLSNNKSKIVRKLQCAGCNRSFNNSSGLTRHKCKNSSSVNSCSVRIECIRCKKTFASKGYLKQHLMTSKYCNQLNEESIVRALSSESNCTTDEPSQTFMCQFCSKLFKDKAGLSSHKNFCKARPTTSVSQNSIASVEGEVTTSSQTSQPAPATTEARREAAVLDKEITTLPVLSCSLCGRSCRNKGALASHFKACSIKNQPNSLKSKRSSTSLVLPAMMEKNVRRLSSTLLVTEVCFVLFKTISSSLLTA